MLLACVPMLLLVSMLLGADHKETENASQAFDIEEMNIENADNDTQDMTETSMEVPMEVPIEAGVATVFAETLLTEEEQMQVVESLQEAKEQEITQDTENSEEDEYSNLAIADVTNYVNVRSTPDTDGEIVGKMYDGSVAQILSTTGSGADEWFQVVSGNVEGYIKAEFFIYGDAAQAVIEDYVTRYAVVKADRLNVRKEPDISASRIGYIDYGEKVKIIENGEEWMKVLYTEGEEGYVASQYVTVEEEFIYAKSIEEELAELAAQRELEERAAQSEESTPENTVIQVTPPVTDYANVSELRTAIVNYAMQFLGNRYVHGGQSLASGTDCSGFTCYIYKEFGINLSRIPQGQWTSNGRSIDVSQIQPGDIVCYSSSGSKCTHVALYIGNGQVIHEANAKRGVIISNMYYDNTFIGIKNVID